MQYTQSTLSLKMSPASCQQKTTPSAASSLAWWEQTPHSSRQDGADGLTRVWLVDPTGASPGAFSTLNSSACPNDAVASSLSDVLETGPIQPKYYLSQKACTGILRRAEKRGKKLPPMLSRALRQRSEAAAAPADGQQTPSA